jgi:hypothetical protein
MNNPTAVEFEKALAPEIDRIVCEWSMSRIVSLREDDMNSLVDSLTSGIARRAHNYAMQSKEVMAMREALEKIADPRKRDHKEPNAYTTLGCVMHIADEALKQFDDARGGE